VSVCAKSLSRKGTNQEDELLFKSYRYLQDKWKRDDEHENIRGDVESSLDDSIVIENHTVQRRGRSNLPILRERSTFGEVGDLTRYIANCDVDGKNLDCYLLSQSHSGI
jgi:hypothetical protein